MGHAQRYEKKFLIFDLNKAEALLNGSLRGRVKQLIFEMHIYPLWQNYKVGNAGETAAKCRMTRETLQKLQTQGLALFHFATIPNESLVRTLSHWISTDLLSAE